MTEIEFRMHIKSSGPSGQGFLLPEQNGFQRKHVGKNALRRRCKRLYELAEACVRLLVTGIVICIRNCDVF